MRPYAKDSMEETRQFSLRDETAEARIILKPAYHALQEKGYDPINQLVGYLLSGDPLILLTIRMPAIRYVSLNATKSWRNWCALTYPENKEYGGKMVERRKLGRSGLVVSRLCLGTLTIGPLQLI